MHAFLSCRRRCGSALCVGDLWAKNFGLFPVDVESGSASRVDLPPLGFENLLLGSLVFCYTGKQKQPTILPNTELSCAEIDSVGDGIGSTNDVRKR